MEAVSYMGTIYLLLLTILVLIGGINYRKGFLILNILGWGVLFVIGAKQYVDYPRPIAVDSTLKSFGREYVQEDLSHLQPNGFFELFSNDLLVKIRASDVARQGFPSGHVMIITCVWLGMALLFRKRWFYVVSISMILLTFLSRLYLGVHYLGDVLGGLLFGLMLTAGFITLFKKLNLDETTKISKRTILFYGAPIFLVALYNIVPSFQLGVLIGFNFAYLLILKIWGEPTLSTSKIKRILNTVLFIALYFGMFFFSKKLGLAKIGLVPVLVNTVLNFAVVLLAFYVGKLMGAFTFRDSTP